MPVHPMAFAIARSLPIDVALTLAVYPEGTVAIEGVPGGLPSDGVDHALLREACRAMTYGCASCGKQRKASEWSRDSLGVDLCEACYDEAGLENEHSDYGHDTPVPGCPVCA